MAPTGLLLAGSRYPRTEPTGFEENWPEPVDELSLFWAQVLVLTARLWEQALLSQAREGKLDWPEFKGLAQTKRFPVDFGHAEILLHGVDEKTTIDDVLNHSKKLEELGLSRVQSVACRPADEAEGPLGNVSGN